MAGKKSRALAAAERLAGPGAALRVDDERRWTRAMVERAIAVFDEIERLPQYDEDGIRRRVVDFLRFADRLELGGIADDAMPLAQAFVERAYQWLARHPRFAHFTTPQWTAEMVEQMIQWFADATGAPLDARAAEEVGRRLRTFAAVVGTGAVEGGDAETLAHAFLEHALRWVNRHPAARAAFVQEQ
ncbi:MAG: hypothetical protein A2138_01220 [Deltaproteobacteria bacterium RBG_16_71_12]|nr:MAG: hypothetical protein A2138_01220 [Deltaproteobacteria bacterium RBG_16_71_12]